ncbi:MAG: FliH/SctL family protein [Halanaerobiales bacterium]|nr:FliH/SctL family protein [Halanaerobiales bacterium]
MSKIIKASQIIGKYKLSNVHQQELKEEGNNKYKQETDKKHINSVKEKEKKAEDIIKNAEQKAKQIISEAEQEREKVDEIKEEAYQEGYQKGKKEAYQKHKEEIEKVINLLSEKIDELKEQYEKELNELQPQLINIAAKMASKIINHEIHHTPEVINNIVEDVLQDLSNNHQQFVINVNPELLPYLNKSELKTNFPESKFEFNSDDSLKKGDCVVNTNFGGKDAFLVDKIERLENKILQEMDLGE